MPTRPLIFAISVLLLRSTCSGQDATLKQFVYTVAAPGTAKHHAIIQTGFRVQGTKGIVTSLHGVVDGTSFTAYNENGDVLKNLTLSMVDVRQDLALLRSDELTDRPADGLKKCSLAILPGQSLVAVGHPVGINLYAKPVAAANPAKRQLSDLIPPSSAQAFGDRKSPADDIDVISIDGNLVAGDSGGPILDSANEVCGVIDGGLLGGAAAISWAIPLDGANWRQSGAAQANILRLAGLDITNLFAFQDDTELASGQFIVSPGEPGKYQSIPDAISKAPSGATILVRAGTYSDYVVVDKPLLIVGEGKPQDVVINSDVDLHSASLNTTLQNLTVIGKVDIFGYATIQNCVVTALIPIVVEDEITSKGQLLYKPTKAIIRQSSINVPTVPSNYPPGVGAYAITGDYSTNIEVDSSTLSGARTAAVYTSDANVVIDSSVLIGKGAAVKSTGSSYAMVKNSDLRQLQGGVFVPDINGNPPTSGYEQNNQK